MLCNVPRPKWTSESQHLNLKLEEKGVVPFDERVESNAINFVPVLSEARCYVASVSDVPLVHVHGCLQKKKQLPVGFTSHVKIFGAETVVVMPADPCRR